MKKNSNSTQSKIVNTNKQSCLILIADLTINPHGDGTHIPYDSTVTTHYPRSFTAS
jgi:hypothetical protein